jgi:hypothetical protein
LADFSFVKRLRQGSSFVCFVVLAVYSFVKKMRQGSSLVSVALTDFAFVAQGLE